MARSSMHRDAGSRRPLGIVRLALLVSVACSGPEEPALDRTPPPVVRLDLVRTALREADGTVEVRGDPGAAAGAHQVRVRTPADRGEGTAAGVGVDGAFAVTVTARVGDVLEVRAVDEAGNASRAVVLAAGAPAQLDVQRAPDDDQTAGVAPSAPAAVRVRAVSGAALAGVTVRFVARGAQATSWEVASDSLGRAVFPGGAWTRAGRVDLRAELDAAWLASRVAWSITVSPGPPSSLRAVSGSEQIVDPGATLHDPLVVEVLDAYGNGVPGTPVSWTTASGSVTPLEDSTATTGRARATWRLGAVEGEVTAVASATGLPDSVVFVATAGGAPQITAYTPDPAVAGALLAIDGRGFSRDPRYDEVFFPAASGTVTGAVVAATPTQLQVQVPEGVAAGTLRVRVCGRDAAPVTFRVEQRLGTPLDVPAGSPGLTLDAPVAGATWVLALFNPGVNGASYTLQGDSGPVLKVQAAGARGGPACTEAEVFHRRLRELERTLPGRPVAPQRRGVRKPAAQRTFEVLATLAGDRWETVTADLAWSGRRTHVYVDVRVPGSELSAADVAALGQRFDAAGGAYDAVASTFGAIPDANGDGALVVLLTPTVNALTPPGSGAYVGGFFTARDLYDIAHSNRMEIVYGLVPDPTGRWGNVLPRTQVLPVLDGVLPHEMQHLVNYNEHVLVRGGPPEELWLNESLSHLAEDVAGLPDQNVLRARRYLLDPEAVSLTRGSDGLAERGAGYLFVRFVGDHAASGVLGRLVATSRVGAENITVASGRAFETWMRDWVVTLAADGRGLGAAPEFRYTSIDLAGDFGPPAGATLDLRNPAATGSLLPTGTRFLELQAQAPGTATLRLEGGARGVLLRVR